MQLSHIAGAQTQFRLLNGAAPLTIGESAESDSTLVPIFESLLEDVPSGGTPLCFHITELVKEITRIAPELRAAGKKAAIVIATDGEASDGDITEAMRPLQNLPCYVVIRLCTQDEKVAKHYEDLIKRLELYMDVISNPVEEAMQVAKINGWLTYAEVS
jgi:hypothetical protein